MRHCETENDCHSHTIQTYPGVAKGEFFAPDHEFPSHLELRLTVTDSGGLSDTETVRLDPKTVDLSFKTEPTGADADGRGADRDRPVHQDGDRRIESLAGGGDPTGARQHLVRVLRLVGRRRPDPRYHRPDHRGHLHGDLQTRTHPRRPGPRLRLRGDRRDDGNRRLAVQKQRHDQRSDRHRDRQIRAGAELRRDQRPRRRARRGLARPEHGHDARGLGQTDEQRRLAHRDPQGTRQRPPLRALRLERVETAHRELHRGREHRRRYLGPAAERLEPHSGDLRRRQPALLRQRGAGHDQSLHRGDAEHRQRPPTSAATPSGASTSAA